MNENYKPWSPETYRKGQFVGWANPGTPLYITHSPKTAALWVLRGWTVVRAKVSKHEWDTKDPKWSETWQELS
jgi:hypothetical protein